MKMPPKRKATGDNLSNNKNKKDKKLDGDQSVKDGSNSTTEADTSQFSYSWEWEEEKDVWKSFTDENQSKINKIIPSNKKQLQILLEDDEKAKVDLEKMIQKVENIEQKLRCWAQASENEDLFCWKRKDEKGAEYYYSASNTIKLETAKEKNLHKFTMKIGRKNYNIDLKTFTHTEASNKSEISKITRSEKTSKEVKVINKLPKKVINTNSTKEINDNKSKNTVSKISAGKPPIDSECVQKIGKAHVLVEDEGIFDVMLNQTNLQFNNNKYYIIQLLEDNNSHSFSVWMRWGRVGKKGQNSLVPCGSDLEKAKSIFKQKFFDKTKNPWEDRHEFKKVPGKYDLLLMDYSDVTDSKEVLPKPSKLIPECKLDVRIKALIEMICDIQAMEETVIEMKYDTKKAPLGKLTPEQIKAGYLALKQVEELIMKNAKGSKIIQACNDFYTRIPHDFGMKTPPVINTLNEVRNKLQLLEALGDIEVAIKLLNENSDGDLNPIDRHYLSLECDLTPLSKSEKDYKIIEQYVTNTHAKTHNQYKLEIKNVFTCKKKDELERFIDHGNRMLLWHGSRLTNWVGILRQGLRIAPPEAPVTGYMFGKGVYFADMCTKSANYCFATRSKNTGLLLLCEVSLGNCNKLVAADYYAEKLPKGKHSVMGLGKIVPNPDEDVQLSDGIRVPLGRQIEQDINNPNGYTLNYNEYIVYNPKQIRMRYLVEVKFDFK